jgi:hypothetical protein
MKAKLRAVACRSCHKTCSRGLETDFKLQVNTARNTLLGLISLYDAEICWPKENISVLVSQPWLLVPRPF